MDAREKDRRIVGYIRDIHETKMRELEQERKQQMDPVTSFYRLKPGMEEIRHVRRRFPEGMLVLVDICRFTMIGRDFGLAFGDVLLEQFSKMFYRSVKKGCQHTGDDRAGSDECWPGYREKRRHPAGKNCEIKRKVPGTGTSKPLKTGV